MESLREITEYGQSLNLTGADLQQFIQQQQVHQRELRAAEREKEKQDREYVLSKEALEIEKLKLQEKKGMEEIESKLMHTIQTLEQKLAVKELEMKSENSSNAKFPNMPVFDEVKDDIDSYLRRFERYAAAQKWKLDSWAVNLSALLRGRALDVYALLPQEKALDYDALKTALLKRFEKTEDGFRQKFRKSRPEVGETFSQFVVRLDRRIELGRVDKTFEGLYDMFLRDQFLFLCNKELTLFLKERIPKNIKEMCALADQYREARHVNIQTLVHYSKKENTPEKRQASREQDQREQKQGWKTQPMKTPMKKDVRCFKCDRLGHIASQCHQTQKNRNSVNAVVDRTEEESMVKNSELQGKCGSFTSFTSTSTFSMASNSMDLVNTSSCNVSASLGDMPSCNGKLNEHFVTVLRDTGCNGVVVRRNLIDDVQLTGNHRICILADGSRIQAPVARVKVDTPYFVGEIDAWCLENPLYSLIIGNIPNARDPKDPDKDWTPNQAHAVVTRQQAQKEGKRTKSLCVPEIIDADICPDDIKAAQEKDETLNKIGSLVGQDDDSKVTFISKKGIIYRVFQSDKYQNGKRFTQLVVPKKFRTKVLSLAHESIMTGHLGTSRTASKVLAEFYWPGVQADVRRFCRSCDICQRTTQKGRTTKVPLGDMPIIEVPFRRVAVDLVGPIQPATSKGNRYILTVVDFATRYPEAIALKGIDTERVAEALVDVFCRVGVPKEMLTDIGTQFTSELMTEVSRLLSIRQLTTTPYHPMCNGLVERFNGTLKQILRRLCSECPTDWDKYLSASLFAYRDAPQESLGFSPFELVYGHEVRGPMKILRELWTKEVVDSEVRTTYQYVVDLKERLEDTCRIARENLQKSSKKYRKYYNKGAKNRQMSKGAAVLDLDDDGESDDEMLCDSPGETRKEGPTDVKVSDELTENEKADIKALLDDFSDVLTDVPGLTNLGVHHIKLTNDQPIRTKPYPLPFISRDVVCDEVKKMLEVGVIEPSTSPYSSPIVIVKKKDGSNRFCIDFRARYWQLPLDEAAKEITAFQTPLGLFQFREHINVIQNLLQRLRAANVTAKPSKCFIGYRSLECLGHIAGNEELRPLPDKVSAIHNFSQPLTKKQVRSFLGLVGFYRKFIPNFSAVASPLTDLTKKGQPNKVTWGPPQENAFITLKTALTVTPVLKLPVLNETFVLQTDASDRGVGAVLIQYENGMKKPVAYASKKLSKCQVNYSTIEKECYAIIWAVQKFRRYLYGKEFLLETDHQPLVYLTKAKVSNARVMRWALLLQPYRFRIISIKGSENVGADCLSRM
ncbi:uncharacterized protein LOC133192347 [Saccostrea echinata]|uniref:uncharacterized protein LOC133192347 n=1 Tax=Saccostrea echinata TaxID=191078 RepID=UPI002A811B08|nr:uncharacterized protein LOC133192347 [Saccostrea echinata]